MYDFTKLTKFLDDRLNNNFMPGFDIRVFKSGTEVYRYINGFSSIENKIPFIGNEKFFMYSCSKPVTCAAAMRAFEDGYFLFTDNISDFLPEFKNCLVKEVDNNGNVKLVPMKREIRIRDLFTMSSGIHTGRNNPIVLKELEGNENYTTRQYVNAIAKAPLEFQPGENYLYGLSHDVLACLIEVAVGMPFNEYVKKVIFDPLEMNNSTYRCNSVNKNELCEQYIRNVETKEISNFGKNHFGFKSNLLDSGGSGLVTTSDDYSKFACAMANFGLGLNGKRILSKSTVNLMRTSILTGKPFETFREWAGNAEYGYGYGVRTKINDGWGGNLTALGEFGWDGAAGSMISIDPDNNIAVVYMQHMLNPYLLEIHPRIKNFISLIINK